MRSQQLQVCCVGCQQMGGSLSFRSYIPTSRGICGNWVGSDSVLESMTIRSFLSFGSLALAILALSAHAVSQCECTHLPPHFAEVVLSAREQLTKRDLPSIAIAVAQHGRIVCEDAFGWADRYRCLTNTASETMDDLAFQLADVFSSGLLTNLDSARKEIEAAEASRSFHANLHYSRKWNAEEFLV
jgi:hypothetical protein